MLRLFTSESVTEGHPDKVADAISDSVLDAMLAVDPRSRVAVETLVTTGTVVVAGEVTTEAYVDIAQGVDAAGETRDGSDDDLDRQGAGDQGLMFGYACNDTPTLMPLPVDIAHRLAERLTEVRKDGTLDYLRPDGKTQVTIAYDGTRPVGVETVVVSTQHRDDVAQSTIAADVRRLVVEPVLARYDVPPHQLNVYVNPTGKFVVGGPMGDAGVTGRKIIVDTYGGMARHGGGAFSGKDPSKVDRSAAYAMRWVAKNVVAAGLADRCEMQVAYAIGRSHPVGVFTECFGTEKVPLDQIVAAVRQVFDLRPLAIIRDLDLLRPIFSEVTNYGHFGRELDCMTWERTDRADALARAVRG